MWGWGGGGGGSTGQEVSNGEGEGAWCTHQEVGGGHLMCWSSGLRVRGWGGAHLVCLFERCWGPATKCSQSIGVGQEVRRVAWDGHASTPHPSSPPLPASLCPALSPLPRIPVFRRAHPATGPASSLHTPFCPPPPLTPPHTPTAPTHPPAWLSCLPPLPTLLPGCPACPHHPPSLPKL